MGGKIITVSLLSLIMCFTLCAQESDDGLLKEAIWSYVHLEDLSYGDIFKTDDTTWTRFRFLSSIEDDIRFLFVERIEYSSPSLSNGRLVSHAWLDSLLFYGGQMPGSAGISVTLEKWKSPKSFVLKIGSSRYLVDHKYGLKVPYTDLIDENDNIIPVRRDW